MAEHQDRTSFRVTKVSPFQKVKPFISKPNFKPIEFDAFKTQAYSNSTTLPLTK
jgi:hypothetical protein